MVVRLKGYIMIVVFILFLCVILLGLPSKKNKEVLSGRTSTNKVVLFKGDLALKGQFVDVKINECKTWTLYGDIV